MSTTIGWIAVRFGADIHGSQRMNPNDFGDHLTFPPAPPMGQSFHLRTRFYINNYGSQMMYPNNFGDSLTFHLVPSSSQIPISPTLWFITCKTNDIPISFSV